MEAQSGLLGSMGAGFTAIVTAIMNYLPQIVSALLLLLLGWMVAAILRSITTRAFRGIGWVLPRIIPGGRGARLHTAFKPALLGGIVFWVVILAFVAAASQVLGLTIFSSWLDALFNRLPLIVLAVLILVISIIVSHLVRDAVNSAAAAAGLEHRQLFGYVAQTVILSTAAIVALDLVGLDISFLLVLAATLLGAVAGGAALAFGLGSQQYVSNLLGVRSVQQRFREGDTIMIAGLQGRIVELNQRSITLETADGLVSIPGRLFSEHPCTLLIRED